MKKTRHAFEIFFLKIEKNVSNTLFNKISFTQWRQLGVLKVFSKCTLYRNLTNVWREYSLNTDKTKIYICSSQPEKCRRSLGAGEKSCKVCMEYVSCFGFYLALHPIDSTRNRFFKTLVYKTITKMFKSEQWR